MIKGLLARLMLSEVNSGACHADWVEEPGGEELTSINPANGEAIARVVTAPAEVYDRIVDRAAEAFARWRKTPAHRAGRGGTANGPASATRRRTWGC